MIYFAFGVDFEWYQVAGFAVVVVLVALATLSLPALWKHAKKEEQSEEKRMFFQRLFVVAVGILLLTYVLFLD